MEENRVAVLGGGPGTHVMAADLTLKGYQVDYMAEGRTIEKLGLSGLDVKQINDFLHYGY